MRATTDFFPCAFGAFGFGLTGLGLGSAGPAVRRSGAAAAVAIAAAGPGRPPGGGGPQAARLPGSFGRARDELQLPAVASEAHGRALAAQLSRLGASDCEELERLAAAAVLSLQSCALSKGEWFTEEMDRQRGEVSQLASAWCRFLARDPAQLPVATARAAVMFLLFSVMESSVRSGGLIPGLEELARRAFVVLSGEGARAAPPASTSPASVGASALRGRPGVAGAAERRSRSTD
eukprot:TRINITY_DN2491_c0_g2_i1.p1 TRINITY_DN2491_c0_g2~~TRINITY_DN2491_c0_g2_i1.p1  ORF type:complete len:235 (-),score=51.22 TRINITY_DN2491_c0_g2_i1:77-781(-)